MQNRIFDLLENVARYGPVTLDQLTEKTGISRSATFRGLKRLEDGGWIRLRLNGRQYVLTSRVEQKLNTKVEPKEEIEQLTPIINRSINLKIVRVRIFQQETTATVELVDDSEYNSSERFDQTMAFECGEFLLNTLQYGGLAVGKKKLDELHISKAKTLMAKLETCNFAIVSEQRFLWLPLFSVTSEVFLLCLSLRNFGQINGSIGRRFAQELEDSQNGLKLLTYKGYQEYTTKARLYL